MSTRWASRSASTRHVTRVAAREFLFIAGMLAPGETFDQQCSGVFAQIAEALKSGDAGWQNVVQFTTYLVHSQDIPKFMQWRLRGFRACSLTDGTLPTRS